MNSDDLRQLVANTNPDFPDRLEGGTATTWAIQDGNDGFTEIGILFEQNRPGVLVSLSWDVLLRVDVETDRIIGIELMGYWPGVQVENN